MYGQENVPGKSQSIRNKVSVTRNNEKTSEIQRIEIKAIRLWSDWNLGLKQWAKEKVKSVREIGTVIIIILKKTT